MAGSEAMFQTLLEQRDDRAGSYRVIQASEIPGVGALVTVTSRQAQRDGSVSVAEALTFVPWARVVEDGQGGFYLDGRLPIAAEV